MLRLGRMCYRQALGVQERLVRRVQEAEARGEGGQDTLVLVEHAPVYTTGLRSKVYSSQEEERLRALGADFVRTNRGGLITFHGPGQLVAYPVVNLRQLAPPESRRKALLGMKWYVDRLEQCVIDLLGEMGVRGERSPHTGVWVTSGGEISKICAMGVHNSNMVTSHGLALNCVTDMRWFSHIVPCGIEGAGVVSLEQLLGRGEQVEVAAVGERLVTAFARTFQCEVREVGEGVKEEVLANL